MFLAEFSSILVLALPLPGSRDSLCDLLAHLELESSKVRVQGQRARVMLCGEEDHASTWEPEQCSPPIEQTVAPPQQTSRESSVRAESETLLSGTHELKLKRTTAPFMLER